MDINLNSREITLILVSLIHRMDLIKSRPDLTETYEETRNIYKRIFKERKEYNDAKHMRDDNLAGGSGGGLRT